MTAKIKLRQYVIFIQPQKFDTADIKRFTKYQNLPYTNKDSFYFFNLPILCGAQKHHNYTFEYNKVLRLLNFSHAQLS